jgi:hypothetical protein
MTEKERFKRAIAHLKNEGQLKFLNELPAILGISEDRISSISKTKGPKIEYAEIRALTANFPNVNWDWVITGEGVMLHDEVQKTINEPPIIYGIGSEDLNKKEIELLKIVTGKSELSCSEQRDLLIEAWIFQNTKLTKYAELFAKK